MFFRSGSDINFSKLSEITASYYGYDLRVIACNSGTQMRVRDSSATRIFF